MRMTRSKAVVPQGDVGASNKHGPPVCRPPSLWLHIRGKPPTRDPVLSHVPARNKAPASHLKSVLVIRPPSLLWEKYVPDLADSRKARLISRGNNYWKTGISPGLSPSAMPPRHRSPGCQTGGVWGKTKARRHDGTTECEEAKARRRERVRR
jgi:hypothetical protein